MVSLILKIWPMLLLLTACGTSQFSGDTATDRRIVREVYSEYQDDFESCYWQYAKHTSNRRILSISTQVSIAANGRVIKAGLSQDGRLSVEAQKCIIKTLYHMRFPATDSGQIMTIRQTVHLKNAR